MPPSRLDGREPASTTRHYYDRKGRLVRSVTTREPEWTELDVAEVQALAMWRASLCPNGCGHSLYDTTTHADTGPEFDASVTTCRACAARLEAQRAKSDGQAVNPDEAARVWRVAMKTGR